MNFEKFSDRARGFVQAAQTIAMRENHQRFLPDHSSRRCSTTSRASRGT